MLRPDGVDSRESEARKKQAEAFNAQHAITDADQLVDQQLYILGKMDLEEYQAYLLLKHGGAGLVG